jgi:hypothetical protein
LKQSVYFERYAWEKRLFPDYTPPDDLGLIIVIPVYKENDLIEAITSLNSCQAPTCNVLIMVLINEPENATKEISELNQKTNEWVRNFSCHYDWLCAYVKLPIKKAGVGLARKIGMDEAAYLFNQIPQDGLIVCYDADCTCAENYLIVLEQQLHTNMKSGIVFYEHRLTGENKDEIIDYECYLRYYIDGLRYAGYPYAHQTLGSCIVVRSSTYQHVGGMNTRKAGEDFYFLNKTIPIGHFHEINETSIYPSDRISDRVPFGTGKAVSSMVSKKPYTVYHPKVFESLFNLFQQVDLLWNASVDVPPGILAFMPDFYDQVKQLRNQVSSQPSFVKRFFHWFDAFRILKYVHFARDNEFPNVPIEDALEWISLNITPLSGSKEAKLKQLREFDRSLKQLE